MLVLKSGRPTYGIVLLVLSSLYMAVIFLPLLYSVVFPNEGILGVVSALEGRTTPSMEAEPLVQHTIATVGLMRSATKVAHGFGSTTAIHYAAPRSTETVKTSEATYLVRFEKHPEPMLVNITCYERDDGQRTYSISEASAGAVIRGYSIPLCLFGLSLFLARKRKSPASAG